MVRALAVASGVRPADAVRTGGVAVTLLVLLALTAWPLASVIGYGAVARTAWPLAMALQTLAVGLASALLAVGPGFAFAFVMLRLNVIGRVALWRTFAVLALMPPFIA